MNDRAKVPGLLRSSVSVRVPIIKPDVDLMSVIEGEKQLPLVVF